ncbi:unnamed protein product [Acanthoscelides obtectus]|uniref:Uncharacterized protein n=1 Tax=Acanthoscelides obtectus TaxID=200917 RepID=A0A9P0KGV8_ACAOB|nr:unnamed protein product [Acanthoscelides obtectus]CAK1676458.1 hypothetical protein AOBTE_LOCUS30770 [Acanthoscelides obtectus]
MSCQLPKTRKGKKLKRTDCRLGKEGGVIFQMPWKRGVANLTEYNGRKIAERLFKLVKRMKAICKQKGVGETGCVLNLIIDL